MLHNDVETRLLLARERIEGMRRDFGREQGRTARKQRQRASLLSRYGHGATSVLARLLGRAPRSRPAYRS
jgi:hypothetical protein